jgi:hypothetical protein
MYMFIDAEREHIQRLLEAANADHDRTLPYHTLITALLHPYYTLIMPSLHPYYIYMCI